MSVFGKKSLNPGDPIQDGGPGDDAFNAAAGSSGINGFAGIDTVAFNFRLVDATVTYSGATVIIDTATSHTELTGIQRYVFTDGTVDENDGNALVDDLYYYSRNHDLWTANGDAEGHFAQFGWQEGRNPSAFFNTKLYLVANSDVRAAGVDPLEHFHTFGWKEGRLPSIKFDTFQYLQNNPDVAAAGVDPLEHFLAVGRDEGRASYMSNFSVMGPSGFDHAYYLLQNPDVAAAEVDPLEHFLTFGWREGRNPNAWFDTRGYLATYSDVAAAGVNPFEHYLQFGWKEGRNPLPAFDTEAYLLANPDVAAAGVNPLIHFLHYGVHEGRSALSEDFNTILNPVVLEGSATGTVLFPGLSWGNWISPLLSFTLTGDSSGGGFAVNSATGALTVASGSLIDFETSGGAHTLTVLAQLGSLSKSLTFTVGVTDAPPTISVNAPTGSILEGAANGTTVGITVTGSDPNGPAPIFTLANDAGGRFTIDASGVISVANGAAIDFETAPGHTYSLTARATVGALSADLLLTINVGNVNEAPAGADHTAEVAENSVHTFTAADFGFTDPNDNPTPNNLAGVVITAITGAGALTNNGIAVANGDFVSAADIAAGNLKFTPAANANGDNYASFAFQVRDDGGTANGGENTDQSANTMTIDVNAVNDTPSFTVGADQTVNEDAGPQTVNGFATGISAGPADEAGQAVDFIVSNNDNALFAVQPTIDASGNLTYTLAADANGSATVTVQIHDNGGGADTSAPQTFVINVNAVNDAPVNAVPGAQSVNEDTDLVLSGANALSISDVDIGAGNATVTLSVGSGVLTLSGTAGLVFSVGDGTSDSTMAFSGTVGAINAALNGLVYRGNLDASGLDTLTLATDDQGNTGIDPGLSGTATSEADTDAVAITVNAVNDAPVNAVPGAQSVNEDTDLVLSGANALSIFDVDIGAGNATATLSVGSGVLTLSGTAGLVFSVGDGTANSTMTFSGTVGAINAALDGLVYRGNLDANGIDTLTLTTDDQGNTGIDPGLSGTATSEADTDAVAITVNAVNDAPVNAVPGAQSVNEDTDLVLSGANALSISDLDIGGGDATVTLSVLSGALTLSTTAGLTFSVGDGTSDSTMAFSGTVGAINAALNGLVYRGNLDASGLDTLTLTTDDQGNTGIDPGLSGTATSEADTDTVAITVNAVNDAPVNAVPGAQSVNEDTDLVLSGANALSISDLDIGGGNATVTLSVLSGVLTLSTTAGLAFSVGDGTSDSTMTFSGTVGAINAALNGLVYRGNLDANGLDTLTLTTDDQGNTGIDPGLSGTPTSEADADTVAITVNPVNDEPALVAAGNNPSYTPGADLFTVTSLTAVESGQLIDTMVLSVTNVSGADESLLIDGTSVPLVNGTTPTATAGVSVTVSLSGTTATVTLTSLPAGLTGAALGTIIENLTYTKTAPALNEPARVVTIVSLHDDGGTANGGDDTANPGLTSTVSFNQPPDITSNGSGPTASVSMNENTTVTGVNVDATDPDNGPVTPLVYSIATGGDGAQFTIDSGTGVLTFSSAPNFENPTDSDTNNTYIVTVRASDGAAFDDQTITITVNDINEPPAITSDGAGPTASITVNENQTAVTDVNATEQDAGQTLTYSKSGGVDAALFNIDPSTGVLTFVSGRNFESPTDADTNSTYVVIVRATDNGTGTLFDEQTITVTVADVNEQPTLAATGASITYTEDTPSENHFLGGLFTGVVVSAVEPAQNLDQLVFTVSNVLDLGEFLSIDGSTVVLLAGNSTTATNAMSVNIAFTGSTATVTVAKVGGVSAAAMQTLIAGLAYSNTDENPTAGGRVVALVSLRDVGSNLAPSDNVFENIGISTTINVVPTNEPPVANPDAVSATEAGGLNNGTAGVDPTGNVIADVGPGHDTDFDGADVLVVQGVAAGVQAGPLTLNVGTGVSNASNFGTLTVQANGSYTYVVNNLNTTVQGLRTSAQTLQDIFSYTINDGQGGVSTTQVTITIHGQNDNPVAGDDLGISATEAGGTNNGTAGVNPSGNVLTNDNDVDTVANGETETVQGVASGDQGSTVISTGVGGAGIAGSFGTLTVNANGSFNYVVNNANATVQGLNVGGTLTDTFTYTMRDTALTTDNALVTFTINGANDAPVAVNDGSAATPAYIAFEGSPLVVNAASGIRNNDTDIDNLTSSLTATTDINPLQGTVTVNGDGSFTYTPTAGYLGGDSFTYHVNDPDPPGASVSLASNSATVFIDVQPRVWHIDNAFVGPGTGPLGSATNPFLSIDAFNTANAAAAAADKPDIIYLHDGTGTYTTTDGVNLFNGQTFLGQGVDLTYTTSASAPGGPQLITLANLDNTQIPVIQVTGGAGNAGITLAQNNTLAGFTIATTNADGIGIEDSNAAGAAGSVGTLNVSLVGISGVGKAIDIDQGGTLAASFSSITSTGSNSEGIQLGGIAGSLLGGSFAVTGATSITNADTTGIQVSTTATNASFSFGATTVTDNAIGSGHNGNGIDLSPSLGNTNTFTFGSLAVTTDGGFGLKAIGAASPNQSTITINGVANTINATGGAAVDLTNINLGGGGATFSTVSSTNSGTTGIQITGLSTGNFTANGGAITNATGTDVSITGGTSSFTYNGTITDDLGQLVSVANKTGGTVAFGGTITDGNDGDGSGISVSGNSGGTVVNFTGQTTLSTGANTAVNLSSNTGATINFNAAGNGLDITTTGTGFSATGGGTVTVQGSSNTINSGSGTAVNVVNTTIGAADLTFQSINSSGGSSAGIVLNNTGSAGGLHVTGTGTAGTGGTIANKTGADITTGSGTLIYNGTTVGTGIILINTSDVSLDRMQLNGFSNYAIYSENTDGFTLTNSTVNGNNGDSAGQDEGSIALRDASGTINITNSNISGGFEDNLRVLYESATAKTATYNITGNTFSDLQSGNNALVNLRSTNTASTSSNVTFNIGSTVNPTLGNVFDNSANQNPAPPPATQWFGDGILVTFEGGFQHTINIDNNTFNELFQAIDFAAGFSADVNGRIYNNTITFTEGVAAIAFGTASTSTASMLFQMLIEDNDIGGLGNDSGSRLGSGIVGDFRGAETARVTIHQNVVRDAEVNPIRIISQMTTGGDGDTHLRITNNTVASIDDDGGGGAGIIPGIEVTTNLATNGDIFLTISGNTSTGINEDGILVRQATANNTFSLEDFAGNGTVAADVDAYLEAQNPGTTARVRTGGSVVQYTTMNLNNTNTPAPVTPLLAADGGVEASGGAAGDSNLAYVELAPIVQAAIGHWASAGLTYTQLAALDHLEFAIADLGNSYLGLGLPGLILIDDDAAGYGWFIDATPFDDAEFGHALSATQLQTDPSGAPAGQMDLLTAVMHEIGHALGLEHTESPGNLMSGELVTGERRLPGSTDAGPAAAMAQPDQLRQEPAFVGHSIVGGFDAEYYLLHNPDVAAAGVDPHVHYDTFGWHEGRNPNAFFDAAGYLAHYADVAAAGVDPLQHYEMFGWKEGRDPSAGFDTLKYLAENPDVAAAHVNPLEHYLIFGVHEGRAPINDGLWH